MPGSWIVVQGEVNLGPTSMKSVQGALFSFPLELLCQGVVSNSVPSIAARQMTFAQWVQIRMYRVLIV